MSGQVLNTGKYKYPRMKVRDAKTGLVRYSANNGDAVTRGLLGMTKDELVKVMCDNGLEERLGHHMHKNAGHFRMVIGQALRSIVVKGGRVGVRGISIASLDQKIALKSGLTEEAIMPRVRNKDLQAE